VVIPALYASIVPYVDAREGKALSWGNLQNDMSAYVQRNYMMIIFWELAV